ncbi:hypothetical protein HK102_000723, partial [Quaeritorhiza haematococci]
MADHTEAISKFVAIVNCDPDQGNEAGSTMGLMRVGMSVVMVVWKSGLGVEWVSGKNASEGVGGSHVQLAARRGGLEVECDVYACEIMVGNLLFSNAGKRRRRILSGLIVPTIGVLIRLYDHLSFPLLRLAFVMFYVGAELETCLNGAPAKFFLEANKWDVQEAIRSYYENGGGDAMGGVESSSPQPQTLGGGPASSSSTDAPSSSAGSAQGSGAPKPAASRNSRFATLSDFASSGGGGGEGSGEGSSDDEEPQNYFAGGEKSGVMMQGSGTKKTPNPAADIVKDILNKASKAGPAPSDFVKDKKPKTFTGAGYRLGSEEDAAPSSGPSGPAPPASSSSAGDAASGAEEEVVERQLTFWRNGFSIDDGPLKAYDDPANQEFLKAINSGRAPTQLLNVAYGQPVEVKVSHRLDEDYKPPPKVLKPFSGAGQRLGAPTAPVAAPPTSSLPGSFPGASSAAAGGSGPAAAAEPRFALTVDESAPVTSVQIRLADGT